MDNSKIQSASDNISPDEAVNSPNGIGSNPPNGAGNNPPDRVRKEIPDWIDNTLFRIVFITLIWAVVFGTIAFLANYNSYYQKLPFLTSSNCLAIIYVTCAGALGGVISNLNYTRIVLIKKSPGNNQSNINYYFKPLVAALVGLASFFLIGGGLVNLTGANVNNVTNNYSNFTTMSTYCGISIVSGYSTTPLLKKLKELSSTIFKTDDKFKDENDDEGTLRLTDEGNDKRPPKQDKENELANEGSREGKAYKGK